MLVPSCAWSQGLPDFLLQEPESLGEGWQGFTDVAFLVNSLLTLTLAAILGAAIAYHPKHEQTADTLEEIEAPKVYVMYAVIGALIGIMVVKYGLVVGFVLFGIGGPDPFSHGPPLGKAHRPGNICVADRFVLRTRSPACCGIGNSFWLRAYLYPRFPRHVSY